ncbi:hypothetical protein QJS10_CPB13g00223 [Acorus calamus]|uniref:MYB transcription factor n=1 Tax=Acorus calamus TaxID=4465 RepID=A0AAV9DK28_ACOCL|nr:hypothetical protein QJS10_CPB13g00223 [Acorus calamus]
MEAKKKKKGSISEEDASSLLQRYTATTVLALLQEVAHSPAAKFDWNALVKKTATGISSAREYQMLWRHLAYRDSLVERFDDGAEPLDDDSDLEFELEASPVVSEEALTEAAACVKVLISSGLPNDSSPQNNSTLEAPLTINIPNRQASQIPSSDGLPGRTAHGMNITVPVSVRKQALPSSSHVEGPDTNGSTTTKKKRKFWTEEEDNELIAAVQKCGEGNWATMLKGEFKHARTATQLSQRWGVLRKRPDLQTANSFINRTNSTAQCEAQLAACAANQAVSLALNNMPLRGSLSTLTSGVKNSIALSTSPSILTTPGEVPSASALQSDPSTRPAAITSPQTPNQPQQPTNQASSSAQKGGATNQTNKTRPAAKKQSMQTKASAGPSNPPQAATSGGGSSANPIQAAALAAGARLANPTTAASFLKVTAQSKNALHIKPTTVAPVAKSAASNPCGPRPSTVHYIRTGTAPTAPSGHRPAGQHLHGASGRVSAVGLIPPATAHQSKMASSTIVTGRDDEKSEEKMKLDSTIVPNAKASKNLDSSEENGMHVDGQMHMSSKGEDHSDAIDNTNLETKGLDGDRTVMENTAELPKIGKEKADATGDIHIKLENQADIPIGETIGDSVDSHTITASEQQMACDDDKMAAEVETMQNEGISE